MGIAMSGETLLLCVMLQMAAHFVCLRGCYVLTVLSFQLLSSFLFSLIVGFDVVYSGSDIVLPCRTMQLRFLLHLL
jgi:hypothetical protein